MIGMKVVNEESHLAVTVKAQQSAVRLVFWFVMFYKISKSDFSAVTNDHVYFAKHAH